MLTVILIFLILEGVMFLIDQPFKNRIKRSTSVETSLNARKQLKVIRIISTVILVTLVCIGLIWLSVAYNSMDTLGRDLGLVIAYAIMKGWNMLTGNIQTFSKKNFLSKHQDDYVFYLRAFEKDFYSTSKKAHSFESTLTKAIKKRGRTVAAIGMTKELDAPVGASRVYVADETWQADVAELMQHARMIFILMSDRVSCIWEILNGAKMLSKICFLIDNTDEYENIKNRTSYMIHFPDLNTLLAKLGNRISKEDINDRNNYIGFTIGGNNLAVFDLKPQDSPSKINSKLDGVSQIVQLL